MIRVVVLILLLCAVVAPRAFAEEVAGHIKRVQGRASEVVNGERRPLEAGSPIHRQAVIETGEAARLDLEFLDASRMTLGADARLVIDELIYDAISAGIGSDQSLRVLAGTFRFLSGAIGQRRPAAVSFATPVGTIGIRGTDFFGGPLAAGMPPGELHYGFMILDGAISVGTPEGSVLLDEPYEGTFLPMTGGVAPTPPAIWAQDAIDEAFASIAFQ